MAEAVDSIIAELILKSQGYVEGFDKATAAHGRFNTSIDKLKGQSFDLSAEAQKYKASLDAVSGAEEKTTVAITRTRKARADSAKVTADVEAVAAKKSADAVVTSEKAKQDAIAETGRKRRPLEITSGVVTPSAAVAAGRNPLQEAAEARGATTRGPPNANPVNLAAEQNSAAQKRALAEAEINDRIIAQLGLKAQVLAADKADATAINDQLFALQQYGRYKALGLSESEAEVRVQTELLAIEEKRARAAAEQAAIVEKQLQAQSGAIANKIGAGGALVGGLVGALGAAEISHLNDRYIELSNTLKVAGVNASEFDVVQQHLLATANRNGTNVNALADVFRSASLGAHDLGASQADLLKLTDAASNALRIQGVSASRAQGSLLQLGHAFESGKVNAREFNSLSLNLYPILQAAARGSDQFGGSVAKLRAAIVAGTVSSKQFFDAIIAGSGDLEKRAAKATLTTEQGFTSLTNALVVYFGEADKAQGVSAALGEALQKVGANLDTLVPAIAAIGTALTIGYISRMAQAAVATQSFGAAVLGAFGGPVGLAITAVTLAIAGTVIAANQARQSAVDAAEGLKALQDQYGKAGSSAYIASTANTDFGKNALGAIDHVNAFAGAIGNLADQYHRQAYEARAARIDSLKAQLDEVGKKRDDVKSRLIIDDKTAARGIRPGDFLGGIETVVSGDYRRGVNALHGGYTDADNRAAYGDYNKQYAILQDQITQASNLKANPLGKDDIPGFGDAKPVDPKVAKAIANITAKIDGLQKIAGQQSGKQRDATEAKIAKATQQLDYLKQGIDPAAASAGAGGGHGRAGPSVDTLAKRAEAAREKGVRQDEAYNSAHKAAHDKELEAELSLSDNVAARANLERERLTDDAAQQAKNIRDKGPKDAKINGGVAGTGEYTAAQTNELLNSSARAADSAKDKIDQDERRRNSSDARSIEAANVEIQKQHLEAEQGLADTLVKRRDLAKQLLDLEYQEKEKTLRAIADPDSSATPAERTIATNQLAALPGQKIDAQNALDRGNQGAGRTYADSFKTDHAQVVESTEVKVLESFNKGLDESIAKSLKLHGIFGDLVKDLIDMAIKQALIGPLANALFPNADTTSGTKAAGGGFIGGLVSSIGKLFGAGGGAGGGTSIGSLAPGGSIDTFAIPGFATGGSGVIGGNAGVDKNVLSINNRPVARVGKGEVLSISPGMNPNTEAATPQPASTVIQQNITYSGAVDIADKDYVNKIALAQHAATQQAIAQSGKDTLAATPAYTQRNSQLK